MVIIFQAVSQQYTIKDKWLEPSQPEIQETFKGYNRISIITNMRRKSVLKEFDQPRLSMILEINPQQGFQAIHTQ